MELDTDHIVHRIRNRQVVKLFRERLGDQPTKVEIYDAISVALGRLSIADYTSESLGFQVGLTWDEKDRLRLTHIACVDRSKDWLEETKRARRRRRNTEWRRARRQQDRARKPARSARAQAALDAITPDRITAAALAERLETHVAFTRHGELLSAGAMRVAMSRALDELQIERLIESETKPGARGLPERTIWLKSRLVDANV